jgi:hypothetical protein
MADGNSIPSRLSLAPLYVVSRGYTPMRAPATWWQVIGAIVGWGVILAASVGVILPILSRVMEHT